MPEHIEEYNGITIGDTVKLDSVSFPKFKRAKVKDIYKEGEDIRYVVRISSGEILDLEEKHIEFNNEACACDITVLMRLGCQCGGY